MTRTVTLPRESRQAGSFSFPSTVIPPNLDVVKFDLVRLNWPDTGGDVMSFTLEVSLDSGSTWALLIGFTTGGGVLVGRPGESRTFTSIAINLPESGSANRRIRGTVTLFAALETEATVETD